VRRVRTAGDLAAVRGLFVEYRHWLASHREVTAFPDEVLRRGLTWLDDEIRLLPGSYGPPGGDLFLAVEDGEPVGCGALRLWSPGVAEVKRVYVRPRARGRGLGARLTKAILRRARRLGYSRVVLDTLPRMEPAIRLYRKLGFAEIPAYWDHPVRGALFFEYSWPPPSGTGPRGRGRP
jgi:GNAT superfamily N-acetyltransferase